MGPLGLMYSDFSFFSTPLIYSQFGYTDSVIITEVICANPELSQEELNIHDAATQRLQSTSLPVINAVSLLHLFCVSCRLLIEMHCWNKESSYTERMNVLQ